MQVTTDHSAAVALAAVTGRVDSSTAQDFENALIRALEDGDHRVVLDCRELTFLSSAGLRALLVALKKANAGGGRLVMSGTPDRIREVLEVSGFSRFLQLFAEVEEAAASFQA